MQRKGFWASAVVVCLVLCWGETATSFAAVAADSVVPRLIQFSGVVKDTTGKVVVGNATLTFSLYQFPEGGTPLWTETRTVTTDDQGHYTVLLGAASSTGLPLDLFTSGAARWLGVQPQLPGMGELPRMLLVGVPYALKAADAETLGGKPASAFVTTDSAGSGSAESSSNSAASQAGKAADLQNKSALPPAHGEKNSKATNSTTITGSGTTNFVPLWTSSSSLGNSALFQSSGKVGIGTTAPTQVLQVNGEMFTTGSVGGYLFGMRDGGTVNSAWFGTGNVSRFWRSDKGDIIGVNSAGQVGIGTDSPAQELQVNGQVFSTGSVGGYLFGMRDGGTVNSAWYGTGNVSRFWRSDKGDIIGVTSTGQVGIGTTTPAATLEVNGTSKFDQAVTFAAGQTFPGTPGLGANTFVGDQTITGNLVVASSGTISLGTTGGGLAIQPNATGPNVIGGASNNSSAADAIGATISGGGTPGTPNTVSASFGTVGGGQSNVVTGVAATVGGGDTNDASGQGSTVAGGTGNSSTLDNATVGGGYRNIASEIGATVAGGSENTASSGGATRGGGSLNQASGGVSTVGGGGSNTAAGFEATVAGGANNTAAGFQATVPGGFNNSAQGAGSLAAGNSAQATNDGTFVWGDDSTTNTVSDNGANSFVARAAGGATFYTSSDPSTGATLPPGSGSWGFVSDRNVKQNFSVVDGQTLLARLARAPVLTWNYRAQSSSIRHMGPMAQDFRAAFGLGEDDKHISTVDSEGVALAAIQELYRRSQQSEARSQKKDKQIDQLYRLNREKGAQIQRLTAQVEKLQSLEARLALLQAKLDRLEAGTREIEAKNRGGD